jgi:hypothetical protein
MAFTMACPNFKKGLKIVSGPLEVKQLPQNPVPHLIWCSTSMFQYLQSAALTVASKLKYTKLCKQFVSTALPSFMTMCSSLLIPSKYTETRLTVYIKQPIAYE